MAETVFPLLLAGRSGAGKLHRQAVQGCSHDTIALAPISAESGSVYNVLAQFTAQGGGLTGYANSLYATQLAASSTATGSARCSLLADCERQLLSDCAVVPLFSQQKRLLIADGIQGLVFDPFGPVLDLTETTLKK